MNMENELKRVLLRKIRLAKEIHMEFKKMRELWSKILDDDPYYNPNLTNQYEDFSLGFRYHQFNARKAPYLTLKNKSYY